MGKSIAITLALLALLSLVTVFGIFCHGLSARRQMKQYKKITDLQVGRLKRPTVDTSTVDSSP